MDDVDRELKEIQLKRERLALEREMALRGAVTAGGAVATGAIGLFMVVVRFFKQWWKGLLALMVVTAAVVGAIEWKKDYDLNQSLAESRAEYERWHQGKAVFVAEQCPGFKCSATQKAKADACFSKAGGDYLARRLCDINECTEASEQRSLLVCKATAESNYAVQNPPYGR